MTDANRSSKERGEWSWKRLWCWLDGHGGIAAEGGLLCNANRPWCKRWQLATYPGNCEMAYKLFNESGL